MKRLRESSSYSIFLQFVKYVLVAGVILLGVLSASSTRKNGLIIRPGYILGFVENQTKRVRIRYSHDGQQWKSGNFPSAKTNSGVGLACYNVGIPNVAFFSDTSNNLMAVWGIGPDVWDSRAYGANLNEKAFSAPSATYVGEDSFLVAFRAYSGALSVRAFNTSTKRWLSVSLAPAHSLNSDVAGVAITRVDDKILLAWRRTSNDKIVTALGEFAMTTVGQETFPLINWTRVTTFDIDESGYGDPLSYPALTNDGSDFYLGVVRRSRPGQLSHDGLFIYSGDGSTWNHYTNIGGIPLNADITVDIRPGGPLLAAVVGPAYYVPSHAAVYRYDNGSWTELDADTVFGWTPQDYMALSLITNIKE